MTSACGFARRQRAPQPAQLPARLVSRPEARTDKEGSAISHRPLLPSGSEAGRRLRTGENGQARPAPPPGAPGGERARACNVPRGNPQGDSGAGGPTRGGARCRGGARPRTGPGREPQARGRYQAAPVRRARAVTWLTPGGSARNGGKRESRGRAPLPRREAGPERCSRGFRRALAGARH